MALEDRDEKQAAPYPNARDCAHGSLRRSCERCEDAARIAELEAECERLREIPTVHTVQELIADLAAAREGEAAAMALVLNHEGHIAKLEQQVAAAEERDRGIVDMAEDLFGPFPVQSAAEALTAIGDGVFRLRARIAALEVKCEQLQKKLSLCKQDEENVTREMTAHRGEPFASHATDAVITLIWEIRDLRAQLTAQTSRILELAAARAENDQWRGWILPALGMTEHFGWKDALRGIDDLKAENERLRDVVSHIELIADAVMSETDDPGGCCCEKCSQPGVREARRQLAEEIRSALRARPDDGMVVRDDTNRLDWLLSFASIEDVGDEHCVPGVVFRIEDAEGELLGESLDWTPRQFIDAAIARLVNLRKLYGEADARIEHLTVSLTIRDHAIAAFENRIAELEAENARLRAEVAALHQVLGNVSRRLDSAVSEQRAWEEAQLASAREAGAREFAEWCVDEESQGLWYRPHLMGMLARFLASGTGNAGKKDGGER